MTTLETRRLDPETDHADLVELFELVFGHTILPGMWEWKYQPSWAPRHQCWVARCDDRIIGYVGAVCLRGIVNGESVPFFQLADAMVHPGYRGRFDYFDLGARHILEDLVSQYPKRVIYGFSNHRAFLWFKRLGLSDLIEKARVCTVRPETGAEATGLEFRSLLWHEESVDVLWAEHRDSVRVGLVRDRTYLRWRYGSHPAYRYKLIGLADHGVPIGWVVLGPHGGKPETPVVDLLLPAGREPELLQALANHLERPVRFWLASRCTPPFAEEKESKTNVYVYVKESTQSVGQLRESLYYTMGDADWW